MHVGLELRRQHAHNLKARLRQEGVPQVGETETYWYGRFAWVVDGEGNRVELWEPDHFSPREFEERMKTMEEAR